MASEDLRKRQDLEVASSSADFILPDQAEKPLAHDAARTFSVKELERMLEQKKASEAGLPDAGGSRVSSPLTEAQMIEATDANILHPKILASALGDKSEKLNAEITDGDFIKGSTPTRNLKEFMDELQGLK